MNILILGAGEVGFNLARRLSVEGNDVVVVDQDAERLQRAADQMDVRTVLGFASYPSVLERAGADNADLLIAATTNDEVNMVACQVAHTLFKVPTKMARLRETEYTGTPTLFARDEMAIDLVISPETEAAKAIVKRFQISSAVDAQDFADGKVQLLGLQVPPKGAMAGVSLAEIDEVLTDVRAYVVAHEHNHRWRVPEASSVLLAGDSIYVAIDRQHVQRFLSSTGAQPVQSSGRHVMMVGGGHVGFVVARELEQLGVSLKVIEHNEGRAEWLSENLKRSVVIHGDAMDRELLEQESVDRMEHFIALTNDDETNILASLIARQYKVPHIITLVNRDIYSDLVRQIGLNVTVSPKFTTFSAIMRHVRKGRILGTSPLGDGSIEVIEAEALQTSNVLNKPLQQLQLPAGTVIGAILRNGEVIIPDGQTLIRPHDRVIMVAQSASIRAVEKLFEVHLEFF